MGGLVEHSSYSLTHQTQGKDSLGKEFSVEQGRKCQWVMLGIILQELIREQLQLQTKHLFRCQHSLIWLYVLLRGV